MSLGDSSNVERAERAYKMLMYYQNKVRKDREEDLKTIMVDALADMMHLAKFEQVNWEDVERIGRDHFWTETKEDPGDPRSWSPKGWRGWK